MPSLLAPLARSLRWAFPQPEVTVGDPALQCIRISADLARLKVEQGKATVQGKEKRARALHRRRVALYEQLMHTMEQNP